jgi:hypothetical protein
MQAIEMEPKIKNVVVRIPEDLHLPLRRKIAELDTSFQQVILEALVDWLHTKDVSAAKSWLAKAAETSRNANQLPRELTPENGDEKAFVAGLLALLRDPDRPISKGTGASAQKHVRPRFQSGSTKYEQKAKDYLIWAVFVG